MESDAPRCAPAIPATVCNARRDAMLLVLAIAQGPRLVTPRIAFLRARVARTLPPMTCALHAHRCLRSLLRILRLLGFALSPAPPSPLCTSDFAHGWAGAGGHRISHPDLLLTHPAAHGLGENATLAACSRRSRQVWTHQNPHDLHAIMASV